MPNRSDRNIHYDLIDHPRYKYVLRRPHRHYLLNDVYLEEEHYFQISANQQSIWAETAISPVNGDLIVDPEGTPIRRRVELVRLDGLDMQAIDIAAGYAWDGSTGPALDTVNFMRGSLVHDALYQLIPLFKDTRVRASWKAFADRELVTICEQDGMSWWRRQWVWLAVHFGGHPEQRYRPLTDDYGD